MPERSTPLPTELILPSAAETTTKEQFLSRLLSTMPEAILCFDRDWRILWGNDLALRISHLSPADFGRDHWEIYPETLGTEIEHVYRRAMRDRTPEHFEFFYPPFQCWYDLNISPLEDGGLVFFYRDVSEKKSAERARDAATRQLRQAFDASPDAVLIIDDQWNFSFANRHAIDLLHSGPLVGEHLFTLFPGNHQEPYNSNYRRTMAERVPTEFEAFYPAPLNLWFRVLARPFEDNCIILFFSDISDRKLAESVRDRTLDQLKQVFEATADGILAIDRNWTIIFLNPRAQDLLSPAGTILGKTLWETFPDILFPDSPYVEHYHRAMDQGLASSFDAFYPAPLNMHFELHAYPSDDGIVISFRDVTESRRTERTLRNQQTLLNSIQQAAGVATWSIDLASGRLSFGEGSAPIFGTPLEKLDHVDRFRDAIHPDWRGSLVENLASSSDTDDIILHEYRMLSPDGRPLWIETRAQLVTDPSGEPVVRQGLAIDITRRKLDEEASEASEARYRVLVDLNPQALWTANPRGEIIFANQRFLDYLGLALEDLRDLVHAIAPEDHQRVIDAWTRSMQTGEPYDVEARIHRGSDRSARWWHLRALPVRDDAGNILQWLGVATDIHEGKTFAETLLQLQKQTESERAEIETLYKTAPIGLALFDLDGFHYLRLNDRQAAFFGLKPEQIVGQTLTQMAPIPGLLEMFQGVAEGRPVINQLLQGELSSHPGEHRFWTVNYFPVYGPDGTIRAISAASLEITQQKKAEAALVQSEKLAAVGRLASSISHEINNPLEAITNLLYLVSLHEALPDDLKVYVHMAQSELSRVSQIATQTLRFHRQAVRPTHVNAASLVTAVLNLYQGRLNNSGITVATSFPSTTPILCFENDIRQVLNNLIANAIDAMRSGGHLLARAHNITDAVTGQPAVRITIADTGHGMNPATLKRIFEPFYTTKDLNGTGLGLWISTGIMERHHGRIAVRSSEHPVHHGTIFSLILPINPPLAPSNSSESQDAPSDPQLLTASDASAL